MTTFWDMVGESVAETFSNMPEYGGTLEPNYDQDSFLTYLGSDR